MPVLSPTLGFYYTFRPDHVDRESLPVLSPDVLGREIELSDQVGVVRVLGGDRLKLAAILPDNHNVLCQHSGIPGLLLTDLRWLEESDQP